MKETLFLATHQLTSTTTAILAFFQQNVGHLANNAAHDDDGTLYIGSCYRTFNPTESDVRLVSSSCFWLQQDSRPRWPFRTSYRNETELQGTTSGDGGGRGVDITHFVPASENQTGPIGVSFTYGLDYRTTLPPCTRNALQCTNYRCPRRLAPGDLWVLF